MSCAGLAAQDRWIPAAAVARLLEISAVASGRDDFALNGTDHRTHAEQCDAIARYLRWRNARAEPKRDFASHSVIRTWTSYQNKVA